LVKISKNKLIKIRGVPALTMGRLCSILNHAAIV